MLLPAKDEVMEDWVTIIISLTSLLISVFFAVKSMQSSSKSNELSESQKTAALIYFLTPACKEPEQWKLFIEYFTKNNRLPKFTPKTNISHRIFPIEYFNRLQIKADIYEGKLRVDV